MQDASPEGKTAGRSVRLLSVFPLWAWLALAGLFGGVVGLGGFTFSYAQGASYLSNDPAACVNCHIMQPQYDGWSRGSHHAVAGCNDCHTPHDSIVAKYAVKALNGFRHSYAFTTGNFPEPIQITELNRDVTQHACLYCHGDLTADMNHAESNDPTDCLTCHEGVGHGK
jgi:cytochrome c nitrite reductase small subunit